MNHLNCSPVNFQEAPASRQLRWRDHLGRSEIETLASHSQLVFAAKRFFAVGKEIGTRDFAFDNNRVTGAFPADGVGSFPAGATLLRKHHAAAVATQPGNRETNQPLMRHENRFARSSAAEK